MAGIYAVLVEPLANMIMVAAFLGIVGRVGNMIVRAISGKEDIF